MSKILLKQAAAALATAKEALAQLQQQQQRCQDAVANGVGYAEQIENLFRQQAELEGTGFLTDVPADTSAVRSQIADLQARTSVARMNAQAAEAATGLLLPRIEEARDNVTACWEEYNTTLAGSVKSIYDESEGAYHRAVHDLKSALARMSASALLYGNLIGAKGLTSITDSMVMSLSGKGTGLTPSGVVVKTTATGQYHLDLDLWMGLGSMTSAAWDGVRADLVKQGAQF